MSDDSAFQQTQKPDHPLANYQFSSDELRVLQECNTESFFQRSLPIGTAFGVTAYLGVKNGTLNANPKFGAVPKVVVSAIFGYFLGKISYQQKCAEKMMRLPNSRIGEILRQKNNAGSSTFAANQALGSASFGLPFTQQQQSNTDMYDDTYVRANERASSLDIDMERPSSIGLDEQRSNDLNTEPDLPIEPFKRSVTYDDLRKENRENYYKTTRDITGPTTALDTPNVIRTNKLPSATTSTPSTDNNGENNEFASRRTPRRKNQYGDEWS